MDDSDKCENSLSNQGIECEKCGKLFKRKEYLKNHQNVIHGKGRTFFCEECGKVFKTRVAYDIHHRSHTSERPYQCGKCAKNYKSSSSLNQHVRLYHKTVVNLKYDVCDNLFKSKKRLNYHILTHNLGQENI